MFRNKKTILLVLALAMGLMTSVANADFAFGDPTNLGPLVNSSAWDRSPSMTADGLELYFTSSGARGGSGGFDIWMTARASTNDTWGPAVNLGPPFNSTGHEFTACISADGLELLFDADGRPGNYASSDLWVTTRETRNGPWSEPVNLGPTVNSAADNRVSTISHDGLTLFFGSDRPGGYGGWDLWLTTRATVVSPWGPPVNLGPTVNSASNEACASTSVDGLTLFFSGDSWNPGPTVYGASDLWITRWDSVLDDWRTPEPLPLPVNSPGRDTTPFISADGSALFFTSDRPGGSGGIDLWQVSIEPVVDLNGDEIVDSADMCIMVDHWGENYPLCDIGPMSWGDGIVDVQDLIVLAGHLFEEILSPELIAYWRLDETEGNIAYESIGGGEDDVMGNPLWQPTGGKVGGAIELDGVDDCVIGGAGPNPAEGPFSILAWIKGGTPGQVIISQPQGANWLMVDAGGKLMTQLASSGRDSAPLQSEAVITDGQWHRIGLVWEGSQRRLCVDGVVAAQDTQSGLEASGGGLYIGVGKDFAPGSYFSGLIDDVRIYNRAVNP